MPEKEANPVFCGDCRSSYTWIRDPKNDIRSMGGTILWKRWVCTACGKTTIYPYTEGNG